MDGIVGTIDWSGCEDCVHNPDGVCDETIDLELYLGEYVVCTCYKEREHDNEPA